MSRKEQYADEIIAKLEENKNGYWVDWIDKRSKDAVIEVCQNVVEDWCGRATDHVKTVAEQEPCENHEEKPHSLLDAYFRMRAEQEPISVSVGEKEPDEISEELSFKIFANTLKCRWRDLVIYNVEWLKKNWQMEMDIVCGVKPCDDVVSRQWLMRKATERFYTTNYFNHITKMIEEAPSVRPQEPQESKEGGEQ